MTIVNSKISNSLILKIVDMTCNINGWEYKTSQKIYRELNKKGIPISGKVETPKTICELLASLQGDFSALLIFGHGAKAKDDVSADNLSITVNRFLFSALTVDLSDKLVILCIFEGFFNDIIDSLERGELLSHTVVAPKKKITPSEAEEFFPLFFEKLAKTTKQYIRQCIRTNSLVSNKMEVYSMGLSYKKELRHTANTPSNWFDMFSIVFNNVQQTLPIILKCNSCRELWLQGEMFRFITPYDPKFQVNVLIDKRIKDKRIKVDLYGSRFGKMVGELKVYGLSGYYNKNICGTSNIDSFIPERNNGRILIGQSHLKKLNMKESSILKDYSRIMEISEQFEKYLILVVHKNGQKDDFGKAISAIKFSGEELTLDFPFFFVRIWKLKKVK